MSGVTDLAARPEEEAACPDQAADDQAADKLPVGTGGLGDRWYVVGGDRQQATRLVITLFTQSTRKYTLIYNIFYTFSLMGLWDWAIANF